MERLIKIAGVLLFSGIALYTNAWAFVLGLAIIVQAAHFWGQKYTYVTTLLPITLSLIAFVGQAYWIMSFMLLLTYIIRCIINDSPIKGLNVWLFVLMLAAGTALYMPYLLILPLVLAVLVIPIKQVNFGLSYRKPLRIGFFVLTLLTIIFCVIGVGATKKRAYLNKGVWANASVEYDIDNLRNASCYSYSEFVNLLSADTISSIEALDNYNELWIMTPTIPFTESEIDALLKWTRKGGNLIVVSDHTDLYGHARCTNQLAKRLFCSINNSATFDKEDKQLFKNAYGQYCDIKTGTNMNGFVFPLLSAWTWEEDAYYANANFFGPLSISGDDRYGETILSGQVAYGLGQISFLQDSTIFSNFAVYQPYVMDMAKVLSNHSFIARLLLLLPFLIILCILLISNYETKTIGILAVLSPLCLPISDVEGFDYGSNPQVWTGNPEFVHENGCPHLKIATAYSLASLSNRKPIWKESVPLGINDVIWVDSVCPPNPNWRWIQIEDIHYKRESSKSPWNELYNILDVPYIEDWRNAFKDLKHININPIFNDRVINDWWYNDGITKNRQTRIKAWIDWLNQAKTSEKQLRYNPNEFTTNLYRAAVRTEQNEAILTSIPKPILRNDSTKQIYLGNGVAGYAIMRNDTISIFGKGQYSENYGGPSIWAIKYLE